MVSSVSNVLSAAIREGNGVRSSHSSGSIRGLSSIEVSLGVVISNSVLVGVGCVNMSWLNISSMSWGISWGSMDNWGMVDSVSHWVVDCMGNWVGNKSMVSKWMGNKSMVGNWVSNKSMMSSMAAMRDNSTMSMADHMG